MHAREMQKQSQAAEEDYRRNQEEIERRNLQLEAQREANLAARA